MADDNGQAAGTYNASSIQLLEGLEAVRKRPGMYIGGTGRDGLHHLLWEIVDNAVDEAMNGYASTIEVTLSDDLETATVSDNGRGIPVDMHPEYGVNSLELVLTNLHAGGKFSNDSYLTSGGLHGVGSSVVNALSETLTARVKRDGKLFEQRFARGPRTSDLEEVGPARGTGTEIVFKPDSEIFEEVGFDPEIVAERLEIKTYLTPGMRICFRDQSTKTYKEFKHEGGLAEFLEHIQKESRQAPIHTEPFVLRHDGLEHGVVRVDIALHWTEGTREDIRTFVNGIPTEDGGTHEQGFKEGVLKAVRAYFETHDVAPKSLNIVADDIREGVQAVVSIFMQDPQFQGQTKAKLNNPAVRGLLASLVRVDLQRELNSKSATGSAIAHRIIQAAKARLASRSAAKSVSRKKAMSRRLNLPGKLADCASTDPEESELFIVEGDSAGGNAKQARDRHTQAILPLRGKVLNAEQATASKVLGNKELRDIGDALGCGLGDDYDQSKLRYHKVILLMDADSDGHHISTLMLTFFYRYIPRLIYDGHLFIAQPPLYRVDAGNETHWALDDSERDKIVDRANKRKKPPKISIQRFKGLGEMMAQTLKETTLDPQKRRLLRVDIDDAERLDAERTVSDLMGRDASLRFDFIMANAETADELDI